MPVKGIDSAIPRSADHPPIIQPVIKGTRGLACTA
jgi:hypothetical protein